MSQADREAMMEELSDQASALGKLLPQSLTNDEILEAVCASHFAGSNRPFLLNSAERAQIVAEFLDHEGR